MGQNQKMTSVYFRRYGFTPATVIDVGVLDGTPFLYKSFPDAKFVLIDPLQESQQKVEEYWGGKIDYKFHLCAASDSDGELELTIPAGRPAMATASSGRSNGDTAQAEKRRIPTRRLDDLVQGCTPPFGLKIDTEGHELSVLRGAVRTLRDCEFVISETSIKRRFPGGYRFSEMVAFMAEHGFEAHSFLSGHTRAPRMADILWVKWNSPRFDMIAKKAQAAEPD